MSSSSLLSSSSSSSSFVNTTTSTTTTTITTTAPIIIGINIFGLRHDDDSASASTSASVVRLFPSVFSMS